MPSIHIAVDVMSGDLNPRFVVRACHSFCLSHPQVRISLIGDVEQIHQATPSPLPSLLSIAAEQVVNMEDKPASALRRKRASSMSHAVKMVADKKADACVSAGNTGALMAFGLHWLGCIDGIERPAICKSIPTKKDQCFLLDLGANLDCTPHHLYQFAVMGHVLATTMGVLSPKVGLLNIGEESHKGGKLQKDAEALIRENTRLEYRGYVEADRIFSGEYNVIVCDGFSGNVLLKACEGAANFMLDGLRRVVKASWYARCIGVIARPVLQRWLNAHNPDDYNGAAFLGLDGIVVKSHGGANERSFLASLHVAHEQVKNNAQLAFRDSLANR